MTGWTFDQMAARAAVELRPDDRVCLGAGLPQLVARHLPPAGAGRPSVTIVEACQLSSRGAFVPQSAPTAPPGSGEHRYILLMEHVAADGSLNLVEQLTRPGVREPCGQRIITDLAVLDVQPLNGDPAVTGLRLVETAPGISIGWLRRWSGARIQRSGEVRPPRLLA